MIIFNKHHHWSSLLIYFLFTSTAVAPLIGILNHTSKRPPTIVAQSILYGLHILHVLLLRQRGSSIPIMNITTSHPLLRLSSYPIVLRFTE
jgi:hypothetical protein